MATNRKVMISGLTAVITAPTGGLSSGGVRALLSGNDGGIAVAALDIDAGDTGAGYVDDVFELAAATGVAFNQWDKLYWDAGNSRLTKTATGNTYAGRAWAAKASDAATAQVWLNKA